MTKEIILKTYKKLFDEIFKGNKKFDLRLGDKKINNGDILRFLEIDHNRQLTGREIKKKVNFILRTKDLNYFSDEDIDKFGFVIVQFE